MKRQQLEQKERTQNERKLQKIKFVVVQKGDYDKFKRLRQIQQDTINVQISDNLQNTEATRLIKEVNSGANLLKTKPLRPLGLASGVSRMDASGLQTLSMAGTSTIGQSRGFS
jgi:hypothetical protein